MTTDAKVVACVKGGTLWLIAATALLFSVLCFVPGSRQREIFPCEELCDYRMFIRPTINSETVYVPDGVDGRDACYPPIAYLLLKALSSGCGEKWNLTVGETSLVASIFLFQCIGVFMLVRSMCSPAMRVFAAFVAVMSPACICPLLRGNPSGWAFALVCLFLCWYRSESRLKRLVAALSLGAATALKISPCIFGVLYLAGLSKGRGKLPVAEIATSACAAVLLVFVPFAFYGGAEAIPKWLANASANAAYYSTAEPTWGFVALANHLIDTNAAELACAKWLAVATRVFAVLLVALTVFAGKTRHRLLFLGAAMAFVTHHDYGGAYLIPAFFAWLGDCDVPCSGVRLLLEAAGWFFVLTPLQFPNPCHESWSMNVMLQSEFLFVLVACGLASAYGASAHRIHITEDCR